MDFGKTKQLLNRLETMSSISIDQVMGLFMEFCDDIENSLDEYKAVDELDVTDEDSFISYLVKFSGFIGMVYRNHDKLLSDDSIQELIDIYKSDLDDLSAEIEKNNSLINNLNNKASLIEQKNNNLNQQLQKIGNLEEKLKEKRSLNDVLTKKTQEAESLDSDIRRLRDRDIPVLETRQIQLNKEKDDLSDTKIKIEKACVEAEAEYSSVLKVCAAEKNKLEDFCENIRQQNTLLKELRSDNDEMKDQLESCLQDIENQKEANQKDRNNLETEEIRLKDLQDENAHVKQEIDAVIDKRKKLEIEVESTKADYDREKQAYNACLADKEKTDSDVQNCIRIRNSLLVKMEDMQKAIKKYEAEYQEKTKKEKELQDRIDELKEKAKEADEKIASYRENIYEESGKTNELISESNELALRFKRLWDDNERMIQDNQETAAKMKKLELDRNQIKAELEGFHSVIAQYQSEIERYRNEIPQKEIEKAKLLREKESAKEEGQKLLEAIKEKRRETVVECIDMQLLMRDHQKYLEKCDAEQEKISGMINGLLRDIDEGNLSKNWFLNDSELPVVLKKKTDQEKASLNENIARMEEILKWLEKQQRENEGR